MQVLNSRGSTMMPMVQISMFPGREASEKAKLARAISDAFREIGVQESSLWITFTDVSPEDWYIGAESIADRRRR